MLELQKDKQKISYQEIQLVEGDFTTSEAWMVIDSLINQKINFHKLQRLSLCEGDIDSNTEYPDGRIAELERERRVAKEFIAGLKGKACEVRIDGVLKISINPTE